MNEHQEHSRMQNEKSPIRTDGAWKFTTATLLPHAAEVSNSALT